jgi:hypothetical protein
MQTYRIVLCVIYLIQSSLISSTAKDMNTVWYATWDWNNQNVSDQRIYLMKIRITPNGSGIIRLVHRALSWSRSSGLLFNGAPCSTGTWCHDAINRYGEPSFTRRPKFLPYYCHLREAIILSVTEISNLICASTSFQFFYFDNLSYTPWAKRKNTMIESPFLFTKF